MPVIPQRELRNDVGAVLRRAAAGEVFTITINGKPMAELGPVRPKERASLVQLLEATPVDEDWAEDLRQMREAEQRPAVD